MDIDKEKEFEKGETFSKVAIKAVLIILFLVAVAWGVGRRIEQLDNTDCLNADCVKTENIINHPVFQKEEEDALSNVPLNEKISIARTGKKKTAEGELVEQSVVFYSEESLSDNKKFYEKWAKQNAWQKLENNSYESSISLIKDKSALDVSFEEDISGAAKITLIYRNI